MSGHLMGKQLLTASVANPYVVSDHIIPLPLQLLEGYSIIFMSVFKENSIDTDRSDKGLETCLPVR